MNRREDLLELTPQALTALANAGFVKRAQREVAAGQLPTLSIDDQGVVTAVFDDGVETRFPPGVGLHDAHCNCPASGMCRHRVTLVLAWQAGFHTEDEADSSETPGTASAVGAASTEAPQPADAPSAEAGQGGAVAGTAAVNPGDADAGGAPPAAGAAGAKPASAGLASAGGKAAAPVRAAGGEARPREARPGEARPGEARPGEARPGEAFSPADFDDAALTTALGATALAQATRFAAQQPTVRVQPWQGADAPPLARLPMCTVRFFSRHNLQLARCDCVAGGRCAHVALAVWAFRQARPAPGEGERVLTLRGPVPFGAVAATASPDSALPADAVAAVAGAEPAAAVVSPRRARGAKAGAGLDTDSAEYAIVDARGDGFGLQSPAGLRVRAGLDALLAQLWLEGAAQPQLALAGRITALRADLQELGWQWLLDALDELEGQLHALAARSTRFDPLRLVDVSTELWARWRCAQHQWQRESQPGQAGAASAAAHEAVPAAEVLGRGVRGEVALDHLRLVSLGGALWSDAQAEGASVYLADPDTQSVLVLEREWPKAEAAAATTGSGPTPVPAPGAASASVAQTSLLQRRVVNVPLRQLLDSQIVTKAAKRRANGAVDIGGNKRQTGVLPLSATAWNELAPPLAQPDVQSLDAHLRQQVPPFVAPRHAATGAAAGVSGHLHVVRLADAELQHWWWDGARQTVHAVWTQATVMTHEAVLAGDGDPDTAERPAVLHVQLAYQPESPGAVDGLARALAGEWGAVQAVAGPAWRAQGEVRLQATAIVCAQRALALAAQPVAPQTMPSAEAGDDEDLRALALQNGLHHLSVLLRDGMRHQGGSWSQSAAEHAQLLRRAGFAQAAQALTALPGLALGANREAVLPRVTQLALLLRQLQA
ncbi:hypothetical protein CCO03_09960 [Comamonas serinivorans]|uniref:SWIM-type domain-containing protein n=1 Tax=Comamonas serinivorans TaxID=1082851 RepID=A0A1Y0ENT4_9BURK|nr:hypothetical protein [Comamonas serinivorans]ARU04962.1 hypothetical protein CCO03_09960 [Comamonas serinivorans]